MTTTTAAAIRDEMLSMIESIAPSVERGTPFRRYREQASTFREWAEANPAACLRRFSIRYNGTFAAATVSNTLVEETSAEFEIIVAYPTTQRYAGSLGLDDIVASDQLQVHARVGPPGYASITSPATVLHELPWTREVSPRVTFAVITYRVDFYRSPNAVDYAVRAIGINGTQYRTGDVITGLTNLRALYVENGLAKLTYHEPSNPAEQLLSHRLFLPDGAGGWDPALGQQYGDWAYYIITGVVPFDRATVIEASDDAVEIEWQVDAYAVGSGVYERREDGSLIYPSGSTTPRQHTTIRLVKSIRMQRGEVGYYVGWHSDPRIGPGNRYIPAQNHYTDYGERELGFPDNAVCFSSAGVTSKHPQHGDSAAWTTAEATLGAIANHVAWMGVCDPTGAVSPTYWGHPLIVATQYAGYPQTQTTGPYWVAAIHNTRDYVRIIAQRQPLEIGVWQFGSQSGIVVQHFANEYHSPAGVPYRHQSWIGAMHYIPDRSSSYANEPKDSVRAYVASITGGLNWPLH